MAKKLKPGDYGYDPFKEARERLGWPEPKKTQPRSSSFGFNNSGGNADVFKSSPPPGYERGSDGVIRKTAAAQADDAKAGTEAMIDELQKKVNALQRVILEMQKNDVMKDGEEARFKREYLDTIQNLDDDNMSPVLVKEKQGMKTEIKVTAEGVSSTVTAAFGENVVIYSNAVSPYLPPEKANKTKIYFNTANKRFYKWDGSNWIETEAPDGSMYSNITQTADKIETVVSDVYTDGIESETKLSQTAKAIKTEVRRVYAIKEYSSSSGATPGSSKSHEYVWKNTYDEDNPVYWVYSEILDRWVETDTSELKTAFIQTVDGFKFDGTVKISGDLITEGTITGVEIKADTIIDVGTNAAIGKTLTLKDGDVSGGTISIYGSNPRILSIQGLNGRQIDIATTSTVNLSATTINLNADNIFDKSGKRIARESGANGWFTDRDGKVITVQNGVIQSIT